MVGNLAAMSELLQFIILVSVGPLPGLRSDLAAHLGASGGRAARGSGSLRIHHAALNDEPKHS
jgi:hypothetical protein